ncbi:unnamed protein product [Choristocarpus tenellus]
MSRSALTGLNTSKSEREYVTLGVELGIRGDGRGRLDYRAVAVQAGVLPQSNGSARVTIAHNGTDVLAAVKVEVGEPEVGFPSRGRVVVCVECSNSLFPKFDERASGDINAMLSGGLERSMRGSEGIDLDSLCILPGKFCWVIYVDLLILQADGNLLDAASFASHVALNTATMILRCLQMWGRLYRLLGQTKSQCVYRCPGLGHTSLLMQAWKRKHVWRRQWGFLSIDLAACPVPTRKGVGLYPFTILGPCLRELLPWQVVSLDPSNRLLRKGWRGKGEGRGQRGQVSCSSHFFGRCSLESGFQGIHLAWDI